MQRYEIVGALTALGARLSERNVEGEVYGDRLDAAARFFVEELLAAEP
jgi:hypothetical protein